MGLPITLEQKLFLLIYLRENVWEGDYLPKVLPDVLCPSQMQPAPRMPQLLIISLIVHQHEGKNKSKTNKEDKIKINYRAIFFFFVISSQYHLVDNKIYVYFLDILSRERDRKLPT